MGFWQKSLLLLAVWLLSSRGFAFLPPSLGPTQSDFGGVGLLQTPTARFEQTGAFHFGVSYAWPYNRLYISVQPLQFFEATIRYVSVKNRLYGPSIAGDQSYKDKGVDFKVRLWGESDYLPAAAVGVRDIGGTGLFGSEYLVFNKRYHEWDLSLGMGWGYLGARGDLQNPLVSIDERFSYRAKPTSNVDQAGAVGFGQLFRGEWVGLFGGINYQPRHSDWSLSLELDGNDYLSEPLGNRFAGSFPLNVGATYRLYPWLELGLGYERGDTLMTSFTIGANLAQHRPPPKLHDPKKPAIRPQAFKPSVSAEPLDPVLIDTLAQRFSNQQLRLEQVRVSADQPEAVFSTRYYGKEPAAIGRAARIMADTFPDEPQLALTRQVHGVDSYRVELSSQQVINESAYRGSPEEILATAALTAAEPSSSERTVQPVASYPQFNWNISPGLRQSVGGPDNFYFVQLLANVNAELEVTPQLALTGQLAFDLINNMDSFKFESNSQLPHVRSDIKDYLLEGEQSIARLQFDYVASPKPEWYSKLSAGYLEMMYAGIGGELLYQPFASRLALGGELYYAHQREFKQQFGLQDYHVITGHLNAYYQSPWQNILVKVSAGRYLAQDLGMTFDLSRQFDSGFSMGVFATLTNVSAEQFGEGSFDKGFYIEVPFDALLTRSSQEVGTVLWRPLTRDGGQKLQPGKPLYQLMNRTRQGKLLQDWRHY